jgi:hypothetical protein
MIRVKIRVNSPTAVGKILRFDDAGGVELESLTQKIAAKLRVEYVPNKFELFLGGEFLVENVEEIDNGDELVLVLKERRPLHNNNINNEDIPEQATSQGEMGSEESATAIETVATGRHVKQEQEQEQEQTEEPMETTKATPDAVSSNPRTSLSQHPKEQNNSRNSMQRRYRKIEKQKKAGTADNRSDEGDLEEASSSDDDCDEDSIVVEVGSDADAWEEKDEPSSGEDDDSEFETRGSSHDEDTKPKAKKRKREENVPESPLQVLMDEKDIPAAPGKPVEHNAEDLNNNMEEVSTLVDRNEVDQAVKDRIIKLLNTGFHEKSNENEAKNAMKLANRLMRRHNISQALLLKERDEKDWEANNNEILKGGMVHVRIVNRKSGKPALFARWISALTNPISKNFDVKSYYLVARGRKCTVTFYGIYTNAQLAGYAFRVATEKIALMASQYQPEKTWYSNISTSSSRLSYAIGVVKGISDEVSKNIKREEEMRQRKLKRARMAVSTGEAYEESDTEKEEAGSGFAFASQGSGSEHSFSDSRPGEDPFETKATGQFSSNTGETDVDTPGEARAFSDPKSPLTSVRSGDTLLRSNLDRRVEKLEREEQAALVLVDHKEKVAEQVLKDNNIKLSTGRRRKTIKFDHASYEKGIEDAEEVDINQRAIRDGVRVKKEKAQ